MAKNSLRDKLDGDELDLSMLRLTEVPVKEIVSLEIRRCVLLLSPSSFLGVYYVFVLVSRVKVYVCLAPEMLGCVVKVILSSCSHVS